MGEIIFSLCVGGFLALSGVAMNVILHREEKSLHLDTQEQAPTRPPK